MLRFDLNPTGDVQHGAVAADPDQPSPDRLRRQEGRGPHLQQHPPAADRDSNPDRRVHLHQAGNHLYSLQGVTILLPDYSVFKLDIDCSGLRVESESDVYYNRSSYLVLGSNPASTCLSCLVI